MQTNVTLAMPTELSVFFISSHMLHSSINNVTKRSHFPYIAFYTCLAYAVAFIWRPCQWPVETMKYA